MSLGRHRLGRRSLGDGTIRRYHGPPFERRRQLFPQILTLAEIDDQPVGGKAAGLARLRDLGLRVPETLVIVGAAPGQLPRDLDERVAELAAGTSGALAVRSSALGEDGDEASFAGQYDTLLNVSGARALREAIEQCLASLSSARALHYREARDAASRAAAPAMSVVLQQMVSAKASGVCFTADPVTQRRQRLVIDSVRGLGEALVAGHASPDHDELRRSSMQWEATQLAGESPALSPTERELIAREALDAEARLGAPLDLEWALDAEGTLFWLQARPITTLGPDPQALDTKVMPAGDAGDVYTRCNIGEMMPGAVAPLTFSVCARGIDVGWQDNMIALGVWPRRTPDNAYIAMSHGHLFINLSAGARFNAEVTGTSPDQQNLAICGRLVPEVSAPPPPPLRVRLPRIARQVFTVVRAKSHLRALEALVARGAIEPGASARETWQHIDAKREDVYEAYARHLTVSAGAGALAPILLRILAGDAEPTDSNHAAVAHVLSGASGVESADIAEGAARVLAVLAGEPAAEGFCDLPVAEAADWLAGEASGRAGREYRDYLARHGHRSLRELDVRQPEWGHDPCPLVASLQAQLRGRRQLGDAQGARPRAPASPPPEGARRLRWATRFAHAAVRNRERSKSLLVAATVIQKRAYRALASQLVAEGRLPDEDAVFFLFHEELGRLVNQPVAPTGPADSTLCDEALARRQSLAWQETLRFPDVSVGLPEPEIADELATDSRSIVGKPVSRGQAEGRARVVHTLREAEALLPGEILVAPITDVGWTPYFAIIAGLVTDVGSAVSHGAVVAREYGLPAVLNTRNATRVLQTGDRIRIDGDRGRVEILEVAEPGSEPASGRESS